MTDRLRLASSSRAIFWLAQAGGWTAYGLSTFLTLLASLPPETHASYLAAKLARAGVGFVASLFLFRLYRELFGRHAHPLVTLGVGLIACGILGALWLFVYRMGIAPALLTTPPPFGWDVFPRAALDLAFVLLAWSGIYLGARYWGIVQEQERDVLRAQKLAGEARFLTLSYQLNPHFLFNSLNSIRALIREDSRRAEEMVTAFADLLRYTLTRDPTSRVTLGEEMEIVRCYLAIEAIRFEERLEVKAAIAPDAVRCLIPAFLVHPLVENAIKHGSRSAGGPLRLRLHASVRGGQLQIEVENTGTLKGVDPDAAGGRPSDAGVTGTRIGWNNIRARLEHLHPDSHRFEVIEEEGWVRVTVDLPALSAQREALNVA